MPQTVLSSPFQHAVLLHVSMFLYSPSPKCPGLCSLKTSCVATCIPVLFSVSNSVLGSVGQRARASVMSVCSAAILLQLVLKCVMLEFWKGIFIIPLASKKSRIILSLNKNTVCFSLWVCSWKATGKGGEMITWIEYWYFQGGRKLWGEETYLLGDFPIEHVAYCFPRLC